MKQRRRCEVGRAAVCALLAHSGRLSKSKHWPGLAIGFLLVALTLPVVKFGYNRSVFAQDTSGVLDTTFGDGSIVLSNFGASSQLTSSDQGQAGSLDPSFGAGGLVIADFGNRFAVGHACVQSDGKILVPGFLSDSSTVTSVVARYNSDGTPDPSFGTMGVATIALETAGFAGFEIASQQDGKLILAGGYYSPASEATLEYNGFFSIVRLNADGSLDTSFGAAGATTVSGPEPFSIALQSNGGIVVVGADIVGESIDNNYAILVVNRFSSDGAVDSSFDANSNARSILLYARAVKVQTDGKIVIAGMGLRMGFPTLLRLNPDGNPDATFGVAGLAQPIAQFYNIFDLALSSDGKILVVGFSGETGAVFRFNVDGSLDQTFGVGGVATSGFGGVGATFASTTIQNDGRIVVAGAAFLPGPFRNSYVTAFGLARLDPNGLLDTTFGSDGTVVTKFTPGSGSAGFVGIQQDGRILAIGEASVGAENELAMARYEAGPPPSDFSLSFSPASLTVARGSKVDVQALINRTGGFDGPMTVTVPDALPKGIVVKGNRAVTTSDSSATFKFKVKQGASAGANYVTFSAIDAANRTRTATLTLNVQ